MSELLLRHLVEQRKWVTYISTNLTRENQNVFWKTLYHNLIVKKFELVLVSNKTASALVRIFYFIVMMAILDGVLTCHTILNGDHPVPSLIPIGQVVSEKMFLWKANDGWRQQLTPSDGNSWINHWISNY